MSIVPITAVQADRRGSGDRDRRLRRVHQRDRGQPGPTVTAPTAARRFLERHGDPQRWLDERPTAARLVDLHRLKAWPWLTWLIIDRRVRVDLELLLAKPGGVDLGVWWTLANQADVTAATETAAGLGWSPNWTRQVLRHTAPVLCLWLDKPLSALTDDDFDRAAVEAARANVAASTADRFVEAVRRAATGVLPAGHRATNHPTIHDLGPGPLLSMPARSPSPRSDETWSATRRRSPRRCGPRPGQGRIKAIRVLCDWLAEHHPDVARLDQLDRTRHIEPFLAWARTRPWRGRNGAGKTVGLTVFHQDVVDLRVFFEDIAEWGWPTAPTSTPVLPRRHPPHARRAAPSVAASGRPGPDGRRRPTRRPVRPRRDRPAPSDRHARRRTARSRTRLHRRLRSPRQLAQGPRRQARDRTHGPPRTRHHRPVRRVDQPSRTSPADPTPTRRPPGRLRVLRTRPTDRSSTASASASSKPSPTPASPTRRALRCGSPCTSSATPSGPAS